ncbi:SGNH/GDSL hydrolase family protein [bacterium]|nr:SGNH/GDSL hydrolase family protein [candidate division CSSED10-310 bacterium]
MKRGLVAWILWVSSLPVNAAVIADHTCTDMGAISETYVENACGMFRIYYGHTSHGSQIITGLDVMESRYGFPWQYNESGANGELSIHEEYGDLGHQGDTTWADMTRAALNDPGNDRNVVMWSWCGGASDNTPEGISTYLATMNQLEQQYPGVLFIYMTGHLDGSGESGNLHQRNQQIRDFCSANNKILFDFADIESYDPDGEYYLDRGADDGCYFTDGNWADEWCNTHPLSDLCLPCDCAHSHALNCNLKARAFWWLMAFLAEYGGPAFPTPTPRPSQMGVSIDMPAHLFRSGDPCFCTVTVSNSDSLPLNDHPLFVILVAYEYLFWAPSFSDYDNYLPMYPSFAPGDTVVEVIPSFIWPPVGSGAEGLYFIAAITNPTIEYILGQPDIWQFGWMAY